MKTSKSSGKISRNESALESDQEPETTELISNMHQGVSNILVAVRCRPLTKKEKEVEDFKTVQILDGKLVIITEPPGPINKRLNEKKYAFDFAFGENVSQQEVFNKTTMFLLEGVLSGYNATVFAYGPTGAGKTYTMLGEVDKLGIMLMSFIELFTRIEVLSNEREYLVKISYLEIYNEIVRDLISPSTGYLDIREDPDKGITVSGLSELVATSPQEVIECLRLGNKRRTCEPTEANQTSSRSHAVLQILIEYREKNTGIETEKATGKLSLIDLAGSERAANTKNRGIRLIEGANINRSLLALGNCINALYEANLKGTKTYIPYRDSKLTRLLKDSLGGNCRTVMIVCISPFAMFYDDTHNTLKYANRAKNIKTSSERNVVNVTYHISKYKDIINELKKEVLELKKVLQKKNSPKNLDGFDNADKYEGQLEGHMQKEAKTKKMYFEAVSSWDELQEMMLTRECELNEARFTHGNDSNVVVSIEDQLGKLKKSIAEQEDKVGRMNSQFENLEKIRQEMQARWEDLPEDLTKTLKITLQQHIIMLSELENEQLKLHEKNQLKQKDIYIQILQNQLQNKIDYLENKGTNTLEKQALHKPKSLNQENFFLKNIETNNRNKNFNYRLQGIKSKITYVKSEGSLPPLSPKYIPTKNSHKKESKIPRYNQKYQEDISPSSLTEINPIHPYSSKNIHKKGKAKTKRKAKKPFIISNSEPESARPKELPKISDKFYMSPYVKRSNEQKKNPFAKPYNVKYGVMIRGIEKLN
ncbi:hypothetical protein SteCoe_11396 [Stentor coeruleus]|uniref:Kinesin-like protein n=1 Tax=Stentor coeruleus TaxID=5963 RepID=A0A1R2CDB3_9CILI|nr:hypothetical protein SteCoe_11396 [Stentor coeruleus]